MSLIAAGIGAVSSLIGGRKAAKEQRRAIAEQNAYNHPSAIRARAEEAGFNPLLFVGPGVGTQTALAQPVMGQAIANAGLAIANGVSDWEAQRAQATALEKQNAELRKALETATLRPKVGGVWPAGATYVPATPAGVDATVLTGRPVKVVGGQTEYTTPGAPAVAQMAQLRALPVVGDVPVEHKWIKIWDAQTGRMTWYPNPDLMDAGPTEMATGMATIAAAEGAQHGVPGGFDYMLAKPKTQGMTRKGEKPWVSFKKPGVSAGSVPRIEVRP